MSDRLHILKTYKTYHGGSFPRSESDRTYKIQNSKGEPIANACRCTRKDIRNAVVEARSAFGIWSSRSAYNRGQILYRIAEMLEGRKEQFERELELLGTKKKRAQKEVEYSIDRLIYFAGWTDKISQVFGTVNPVASSHFNFSVPEPTGVVGLIGPDESPLLSAVSLIAPIIAGGNSCIFIASTENPLSAVSFGEVLHASDVPGGVVNILTGYRNEMVNTLSSHLDVNAIYNAVSDKDMKKQINENASKSVKRVKHNEISDWDDTRHESPYIVVEFLETKTTWHPVGT